MYYNRYPSHHEGDRFFFFPFLGPLLLGGIGGAAIASAYRPRPIVVTPPPVMPLPYYPPRPYFTGYNQYSGYNYY